MNSKSKRTDGLRVRVIGQEINNAPFMYLNQKDKQPLVKVNPNVKK